LTQESYEVKRVYPQHGKGIRLGIQDREKSQLGSARRPASKWRREGALVRKNQLGAGSGKGFIVRERGVRCSE